MNDQHVDAAGGSIPVGGTAAPWRAAAMRQREPEAGVRGDDPGACRRYVLISPARDEARFARRTIESVAAQTLPPAEWVVVDDGSTDGTAAIVAEYARQLPWLRLVRRPAGQPRRVGPGVIDAFYAGLATVQLDAYPYLCKLDLDLVLPPQYFERLIERMEAEPRLGTCSGKAYYRRADGRWVSEGVSDEMSVGAMKLYRTACFRDIGGFVRAVMWDGIDCHRCRMLGWAARSWDEPELRVEHLRPMGSSHRGLWHGRMRHGRGQWYMGTGLGYMTASAAYRVFRPPIVVGAVAMWWGYVRAAWAREPRYPDLAFRRFLREYQRRALMVGKKRATAWAERRGAGGMVAASAMRAGPKPVIAPAEAPLAGRDATIERMAS